MGKGSACQPVPGRPMVVCLQNIMSNRDLAQLAQISQTLCTCAAYCCICDCAGYVLEAANSAANDPMANGLQF